MFEDRRVSEVRRLIAAYVESPSLRHVRDPKSVSKLAEQIVRAFDCEIACNVVPLRGVFRVED